MTDEVHRQLCGTEEMFFAVDRCHGKAKIREFGSRKSTRPKLKGEVGGWKRNDITGCHCSRLIEKQK